MKYDEETPIKYILYGQFIKYTSLFKMVSIEFSGSDAEEVNIFIDLYQFLLPIFRYLNIENYNIICSIIINYCAHLRAYFRSRHRVETNIILVYSSNNSINNYRFYSDYNYAYKNRINSNNKIMDAVMYNLQLLQVLCPYLPNIYIKIGTVEPAVIIKNIIDNHLLPDEPNIVISNSQYMYQLPANADNVTVFRKKTIHKEDASYSYNVINAMQAFIFETRKINISEFYNTRYLSILMTLTGLPQRNVKSFYSLKIGIDILNHIPVECIGDITAIYDNIVKYITYYKKKYSIIDYEDFCNKYRSIDIEYQSKLYQKLPECLENSWLQDRNDPDNLKAINNKYFKDEPLNLEWI